MCSRYLLVATIKLSAKEKEESITNFHLYASFFIHLWHKKTIKIELFYLPKLLIVTNWMMVRKAYFWVRLFMNNLTNDEVLSTLYSVRNNVWWIYDVCMHIFFHTIEPIRISVHILDSLSINMCSTRYNSLMQNTKKHIYTVMAIHVYEEIRS